MLQVVIDQPIGTLKYAGVAKGLYVASTSGFLTLQSHTCWSEMFSLGYALC